MCSSDLEGAERVQQGLERRRRGVSERYELTLKHRDGSDLVTEVVATPMFAGDGSYAGSLAMFVDAAKRRRAQLARERVETRLQQTQRLESVGQLAGGIAHDFNNILAVILNAAYFVRGQLPADSPVRDDVEEIRRAAERASELTRQLLIFSRRDPVTPEVLDLNALVADVERLLRRTLGERVTLTTAPGEGELHVEADAAQLEQVVVNLVMNARDAMPDGGPIAIATRTDGERVELSVTDEGVGMEPEVAARAFEPFFTTKPKGAGTGLGLATVYGTVTNAGGMTRIESAPGRGTTVRLWLPAVAPPAASEPVDAAGATILLVEDEEPVRSLTRRILASSGFECLDAPGGAEALALYEEHRDRIDLLLTDCVMPGMSGPELAERIAAGGAGPPVLFMSGYADDVPGPLIQKPFSAVSLLRSVGAALASAPRDGE